MKDNVKNQQARAVLKRRIISFPNDGELRVESIIREFVDYAMIDCKQYDKVVLQFITASVYPLKKRESYVSWSRSLQISFTKQNIHGRLEQMKS